MKTLRPIALAFVLVAALAAAPAASVRVPQAQIDAENARWTSLGVKLPPGGIVTAHPYAAPYSNRSFVVPFAWYSDFYAKMHAQRDVPEQASAVRADLPVLELLLEKTYAGYGTASERGWSWNKMFREWDAQLGRDGKRMISLREAFAPWGRLEEAQPDNSSGVAGYTGFSSGSASAVLASNPQGSCSALRFAGAGTLRLDSHDAAQQPHAVQSWNGSQLARAWYVSYPKRLGTASAIRCGARDIALTTAAQVAAPSQNAAYTTIGDGIAYVRLPTLTDANSDALHAALAKASDLGRERLVIFDLRGNTNGVPSDLLTNWFAESAVEIASGLSQSGSLSCFTAALDFGAQQQFVSTLKAPVSPGLQQALQQLVDGLKGTATPDCSVEPQSKSSDRSMADHQFAVHSQEQGQTRVVALVDGGCRNECEFLTYVLAGLPDTVIAGTSTYGSLGFSRPGYFVLPHSRVPFRLALGRADPYGDGRSVDGYGIAVDVLLPTAQAQSTQSLAALAKLLAG